MIKYRDGYDGQLAETACFQLPSKLHPYNDIETEFINLNCLGKLTIKIGYSWDYASVPLTHWLSNIVQGKKSKTPSIVHDALCQLHRQGHLMMPSPRLHADRVFYDLLLERGFWKMRAWLWFKAVRLGAKYHNQKPKEIRTAP